MTKLAMPKIDRKLIAKKADVIANLKKIIKTENILTPYLIEKESYCKINDIIKESNIDYVRDILYPQKTK